MKKALLAITLLVLSIAPIAQATATIDIKMDSPTTAGVLLAALGAYLTNNKQSVVGIPTLVTGVAMATDNSEVIKSLFTIANNTLNASYNVVLIAYKKLAEAYTSITTACSTNNTNKALLSKNS